MKCPNCGNPITKRRRRCELCGQDISVYERLYRLSNSFYNRGLERAKHRDLSGAIEMLKKSLELNKENMAARNLLGLVYYEIGEAVSALGEWVISANFCPENNEANRYMETVQADSAEFANRNKAIENFNLSLENVKKGSDDMAMLTLKGVISLSPRYVKALLLLALLYIKNCEYENARRCLVRVQKIDVTNLTALRYMEEIRLHTEASGGRQKTEEEPPVANMIAPVSSYREDKPNFMAFITFFLGILLGVAVIYYMAVPNIRRGIVEEYNQKERDYSATLSAGEATIASLESNIRILESKISDLERTLAYEEGYVLTDYEPLIEFLYEYRQYLKQEEHTKEETEALAQKAAELDMSQVTKEEALSLYREAAADLGTRAADFLLRQAMEPYAAGENEEARLLLEAAYRYDTQNAEILYHLARVYHRLGMQTEAEEYYRKVITEHADSNRVQEAQTYLELLLGTGETQE